eukprot:CAMPEP_0194293834 /NCGR_PEP_ID=MMETSP0169-20130528/48757_1 /TAXON_ID=218684 /ORGANISM="Corethron pennatum, Strain L29A3" /LENGTH=259 /DNA_ID=CAMNT_0039042491 /DNA_START=101 /DNA_END=877 /DNA_ORIENTATION=-
MISLGSQLKSLGSQLKAAKSPDLQVRSPRDRNERNTNNLPGVRTEKNANETSDLTVKNGSETLGSGAITKGFKEPAVATENPQNPQDFPKNNLGDEQEAVDESSTDRPAATGTLSVAAEAPKKTNARSSGPPRKLSLRPPRKLSLRGGPPRKLSLRGGPSPSGVLIASSDVPPGKPSPSGTHPCASSIDPPAIQHADASRKLSFRERRLSLRRPSSAQITKIRSMSMGADEKSEQPRASPSHQLSTTDVGRGRTRGSKW